MDKYTQKVYGGIMQKKLIVGISAVILSLAGGLALASSTPAQSNPTVTISGQSDPTPTDTTATPDAQTGSTPTDPATDSNSTAGGSTNTPPAGQTSSTTPTISAIDPSPAPAPTVTSKNSYYTDVGDHYDEYCAYNYSDGTQQQLLIGGYKKGTVKILYDCPDTP